MERAPDSDLEPDSDSDLELDPGPERSSPWPVVAALGIVATEAGVLFGLAPIAVGGVLAVGTSGAGMAREVGYAGDLWRSLRVIGAVIAVLGSAVWIAVAPAPTPDGLATAAASDGIAVRAAVVCGAAAVLLLAGLSGPTIAGRR